MINLWRAARLVIVATVVLAIAFALTGVANGLALLVYVLFLAAVLLALMVGRLRAVLPPAADFRKMPAKASPAETHVEQFETVKRWVVIASHGQSDLFFQLRPLVRDIVAARLSRNYSINLEREPDRAAAILGDGRAWQLVRPDWRTSAERSAPGWTEHELEQLVEELESL